MLIRIFLSQRGQSEISCVRPSSRTTDTWFMILWKRTSANPHTVKTVCCQLKLLSLKQKKPTQINAIQLLHKKRHKKLKSYFYSQTEKSNKMQNTVRHVS